MNTGQRNGYPEGAAIMVFVSLAASTLVVCKVLESIW